MDNTYTQKSMTPIFDSCFRGLCLCIVLCACMHNSYGIIYKTAEMQSYNINGTIITTSTLNRNRVLTWQEVQMVGSVNHQVYQPLRSLGLERQKKLRQQKEQEQGAEGALHRGDDR